MMKRQPAGTPTGGEFAPQERPDSGLSLDQPVRHTVSDDRDPDYGHERDDSNPTRTEQDGTKFWEDDDGRRHRDDGPAVIYPNGDPGCGAQAPAFRRG